MDIWPFLAATLAFLAAAVLAAVLTTFAFLAGGCCAGAEAATPPPPPAAKASLPSISACQDGAFSWPVGFETLPLPLPGQG